MTESSRKRPLPTGYSMMFQPEFGTKKMAIGYLDITVIGANNLIAVDRPLLIVAGESTSDPYCQVSLDDRDQETQTRTVNKNINPNWSYSTTLVITNPASTLFLRVIDEESGVLDVGHSDVPLAELRISLSTLPYNETIEGWFALSPPSGGVTPINQPSSGDSADSAESATSVDCQWGQINLRMRYATTPSSQFYSGFLPPPPAPEVPVLPFSADLAYTNLNRCLEYLWPILDVVWSLMDIQSWVSPLRSIIFIMLWWLLCRNYYWIPIADHVYLIVKMSMEFVRLHIQNHPHGASVVDKLRKTIRPTEVELKEEVDNSLGPFLDKVAMYLIGQGQADSLQSTQNFLGSFADSLDVLNNYLTWKHRDTSKKMLIGLLFSCCLFALMPFHYWLLFASLWIMTSNTRPYALVMYTLNGLARSVSLSPTIEGMKVNIPALIQVRKISSSAATSR